MCLLIVVKDPFWDDNKYIQSSRTKAVTNIWAIPTNFTGKPK
jgi:hypothetical protein